MSLSSKLAACKMAFECPPLRFSFGKGGQLVPSHFLAPMRGMSTPVSDHLF